jgi:hypothetical protein
MRKKVSCQSDNEKDNEASLTDKQNLLTLNLEIFLLLIKLERRRDKVAGVYQKFPVQTLTLTPSHYFRFKHQSRHRHLIISGSNISHVHRHLIISGSNISHGTVILLFPVQTLTLALSYYYFRFKHQ